MKYNKDSQYSPAVNKSPRFLFSCARSTILKEKIEDIGTGLSVPSFNLGISRQYLLLPTNFTEKRALGAHGMKVPNDIKIHQWDMLPCDTSCMLYQGLGCFFWGIINIRGFIP